MRHAPSLSVGCTSCHVTQSGRGARQPPNRLSVCPARTDGSERQFQLQVGDFLGNPGWEGIAVGAREYAVLMPPGVVLCHRLDLVDQFIHSVTSTVQNDFRSGTKPV